MANNPKPVIRVVCALIENGGKLLAVRRKRGEKMEGRWEFPGGKVEKGEAPVQSITREIKEELSLLIYPHRQLPTIVHEYPGFIIHLIPFHCYWREGLIHLRVHDKLIWAPISELDDMLWSEADHKVVREIVSQYIKKD